MHVIFEDISTSRCGYPSTELEASSYPRVASLRARMTRSTGHRRAGACHGRRRASQSSPGRNL